MYNGYESQDAFHAAMRAAWVERLSTPDHENGDCWAPTCPACQLEEESSAPNLRCEECGRRVRTTDRLGLTPGDWCPRCGEGAALRAEAGDS